MTLCKDCKHCSQGICYKLGDIADKEPITGYFESQEYFRDNPSMALTAAISGGNSELLVGPNFGCTLGEKKVDKRDSIE